MRILVTVGSSEFNELIQAVDEQLADSGHEIICQIGNGSYVPKSFEYFRFADNFTSYYQNVELVISHGGGGTVFELLEHGKRILVIPNCMRSDKHQLDLANYIEKNHLGAVCYELEDLESVFLSSVGEQFTAYHKDEFFYAENILDYFGLGVKS